MKRPAEVSELASESQLTCDILYAHISCIITRIGLPKELLSGSLADVPGFLEVYGSVFSLTVVLLHC